MSILYFLASYRIRNFSSLSKEERERIVKSASLATGKFVKASGLASLLSVLVGFVSGILVVKFTGYFNNQAAGLSALVVCAALISLFLNIAVKIIIIRGGIRKIMKKRNGADIC
jgi:F0F1-type ATP synthase assembly protein I